MPQKSCHFAELRNTNYNVNKKNKVNWFQEIQENENFDKT